ncbi:MAG: hypothetical protein ACTSPB_08725 [Candidatus Thorarchaeota archaeon]
MSDHIFKNEWMSIYPEWKGGFQYETAGYFDTRHGIHTQVTSLLSLLLLPVTLLIFGPSWILFLVHSIFLIYGYGQLFIHFPWKSNIYDAEGGPEYGWYWYHPNGNHIPESLWLCLGKKKKCIYMPWSYDWIRTSVYRKDGRWEHEMPGNRKEFWKKEWDEVILKETHPYVWKVDGEIIQEANATITVEQRKWRPRWFKWTSLFNYVKTEINVEFDRGMGPKRGTWKGGVVGTSFIMLDGETSIQTLQRMQREYIFR